MTAPRRDAAQAQAEAPEREKGRPREEDPAAGGSPSERADHAGEPEPAAPARPHGDELMEEAAEAGDGRDDPATEATEAGDEDGGAPGDEDGEAAGEAEDPLAVAERERDEYLALAQRTQADLANFRKRAAREAAGAGGRAKAAIVRELLPAVDNLERALAAAGHGDESLLQGVRLVHSDLTAALERNGVESFEPAGEAFDPNVHEAISTRAEDGADPGVVLDVVEKGYRLDGTILRPARVVVTA